MKTIKLKNPSLKIGLTVGAGVILLVIFFHFILDNLIRNQLVNHAEERLKTEVSISKVKISLLGDTTIEDIEIKNKQGFSQQNILEIKKVILRGNFVSFLKDVALIEKLTIEKPRVYIEINEKLKTNFEYLSSLSKTKDTVKDNSSNNQISLKKIILKKTSIVDMKVYIKSSLLGTEKVISIPDAQQINIGLKENGISLKELNKELIKIAYTKLKEITKKNIGFSKEKLKAEIEKQLLLTKKEIKKSSGKIKESVERKILKQIFNN